jgi:hypothetical protein
MTWPAGWSKDDQIRWMEQRLWERNAEKEGKKIEGLDAKGIPDALSLECWLAKKRDGLSWQEIVIKLYPQYRKSKTSMIAGISKARRDFELAETPNPKKMFKATMDDTIREVFACSPQQFKKYIDSIRPNRVKK